MPLSQRPSPKRSASSTDRGVAGQDELGAHLDDGAVAEPARPDAPADPVARLEHDDLGAGPLQLVGGHQAGEPSADHHSPHARDSAVLRTWPRASTAIGPLLVHQHRVQLDQREAARRAAARPPPAASVGRGREVHAAPAAAAGEHGGAAQAAQRRAPRAPASAGSGTIATSS